MHTDKLLKLLALVGCLLASPTSAWSEERICRMITKDDRGLQPAVVEAKRYIKGIFGLGSKLNQPIDLLYQF